MEMKYDDYQEIRRMHRERKGMAKTSIKTSKTRLHVDGTDFYFREKDSSVTAEKG
jgi:hypothetical protein